jgi:hypothetical protein
MSESTFRRKRKDGFVVLDGETWIEVSSISKITTPRRGWRCRLQDGDKASQQFSAPSRILRNVDVGGMVEATAKRSSQNQKI